MTNQEGVVYGVIDIREPERIRYVGQTVNLVSRKSAHRGYARNGSRKGPLYSWMPSESHKPEFVEFLVLESGTLQGDELDQAEVRWISNLRSVGQADLNLAPGGMANTGHVFTSEEKENHAQAKLNWNKVRSIRERRVREWVSDDEMAEGYGVTSAVINRVLHNLTWTDECFNPDEVVRDRVRTSRVISPEQVNKLRQERMERWKPLNQLAQEYGVAPRTIRMVLRNEWCVDPAYNPGSLALPTKGGVLNPKVTEEEKTEVRRLFESGETQKDLAERFGVSRRYINQIVRDES